MLYKQTVLLTGITFIALVGFVLRLEQLYFMAAVLAFLTLGSYALSRLAVRGLELERGSVRKIYEGDWCDLTLTVTNHSLVPKVFVELQDRLPRWLEPVGKSHLTIAMLLPHRSVKLAYRVRGVKRGAFQLGPIMVSSTDPLGAFTTAVSFEQPQELIVYPVPVRVFAEALAGATAFGGGETEQISATEAGMEFYGIRDYQPGDALRRIHWPSTARLGHLHVVQFEKALGADMVIAVDLRRGAHGGEGRDSSLETAIKAAASLAVHAVENGTEVVVMGQDARRRYRAAAQRPQELPIVLEALARMEADGETSLGAIIAAAGELAIARTAVLLTAAPDEEMPAEIEKWMRRQAQVVVILFDAASYGARAAADVYAWQRRLAAAGARVEVIRRGEELEGALGRAVADAA